MAACRRAYKKHKPDIVMYVDRADVIRRNFEDEPLLRTITQVRVRAQVLELLPGSACQ